ncbi:hypothetical protein E2C01_007243 [Portunus trituberculatus]|uniref:Uncharacterized protein n=1 Tax=Portunus trituberculatus TaxID=210409 RepID=A0A5B7D1W3_PORTR|nr:hypothetical protein [Portunus trituberculatus]
MRRPSLTVPLTGTRGEVRRCSLRAAGNLSCVWEEKRREGVFAASPGVVEAAVYSVQGSFRGKGWEEVHLKQLDVKCVCPALWPESDKDCKGAVHHEAPYRGGAQRWRVASPSVSRLDVRNGTLEPHHLQGTAVEEGGHHN